MEEKRDKVPVNVAARIVGRSERTVRRWVRDGKVTYDRPSSRKTMIPRDELEVFRQED